MRGGVTSNAAALARRMLARRGAVERELTKAAQEIGREVSGASKGILQSEIYNQPIPLKASADKNLSPGAKVRQKTTKGKHGAWQRSGSLKRAESWRSAGPTVILTNNAGHALARFRLGTPQGKSIKSPGVQSVQWQPQAVRERINFIRERRRKAVLRALEKG